MDSQKMYRKKDRPNLPPVTIVNENDKFLSLSNGDTVLKNIFSALYEDTSVNQFVSSSSDEIDPKAFLSSTKLGGIVNQFTNNGSENPAVQQQPRPQEPEQRNVTRIDNTKPDVVQGPVTRIDNTKNVVSEEDQLFDDEVQLYGVAEATKRKRDRMKKPSTVAVQQPSNDGVSSTNQPINHSNNQSVQHQMSAADMMFKSFKRNHEIVFKFEFKEKIGSPEFVRMMIENIDGDIVAYYKKIIMDTIMAQSEKVGNEVEYQIRKEIFGEKVANESLKNSEVAKPEKKKTAKPKVEKPVKVKQIKARTIPSVSKTERAQLSEGASLQIDKSNEPLRVKKVKKDVIVNEEKTTLE